MVKAQRDKEQTLMIIHIYDFINVSIPNGPFDRYIAKNYEANKFYRFPNYSEKIAPSCQIQKPRISNVITKLNELLKDFEYLWNFLTLIVQ